MGCSDHDTDSGTIQLFGTKRSQDANLVHDRVEQISPKSMAVSCHPSSCLPTPVKTRLVSQDLLCTETSSAIGILFSLVRDNVALDSVVVKGHRHGGQKKKDTLEGKKPRRLIARPPMSILSDERARRVTIATKIGCTSRCSDIIAHMLFLISSSSRNKRFDIFYSL